MTRLDALLHRHPLPTWRIIVWPVILLSASFLIWANFGTLDEVSTAAGEVIPRGKVKVVQHLEGGIIQAIYVREGDRVEPDQPLVQLDLGVAALNREELEVRLDGALLRRARLLAEVSDRPLDLPGDSQDRQPALAKAETDAYLARRRELETVLSGQQAQIEQRELQVQELEARKRSASNNLDIARERLRMSQSLLTQGLTARMEHLQHKASVEHLEGEISTLEPAIPRSQAAVVEARQKLKEARERYLREAQEQLGRAEEDIARLKKLLGEATRQGLRAEIRSPTEGIVKNIRYNTIGGVVSAGEAIMEIVPTGDRLVIEARLSPTDRGYVAEGQRAVVKVTAYDFVRYGGLDSTVVAVAPDTSTDQNGMPYFRVIVETDKTYLGDEEGRLPISPGMQAMVDIHTGQNTVMHYMIKPVLKIKSEAFNER
jgi:membrane fusion protein, adhesin transport system